MVKGLTSHRKPSQGRWSWGGVVLFSLLCWQVYGWRDRAWEATVLQVKYFLFNLNEFETIRLVDLCGRFKNLTCESEVLGKFASRYPQNKMVLARLSLNEARLGHCSRAFQILDQYKALGGSEDHDSLYWQALCYQKENKNYLSMELFYKALAQDLSDEKSARALIKLLLQAGRPEEALSVMGALTGGEPQNFPVWRQVFAEVMNGIQWPIVPHGGEGVQKKYSFRLPFLDGQFYWMPFRLDPSSSADFIAVSLSALSTELNRKKFSPILRSMRTLASQTREGAELQISAVQIGPWLFEDLNFQFCDACTSVLGRSFLNQLEVSETIEAGVSFIVLSLP